MSMLCSYRMLRSSEKINFKFIFQSQQLAMLNVKAEFTISGLQ